MKMKTVETIITIFICILLALCIGVGICNWFNNDKFWTASVTQIITLLVAIGIAFWATQYKNDKRKMKDHAIDIIKKLQEMVSNDKFCKVTTIGEEDDVKKNINISNRKISNCLSVLKEYANQLGFSDDLKYINDQFDVYKNLTGDHINDMKHLKESENDFRRIAENIDSRCDRIILSMYK